MAITNKQINLEQLDSELGNKGLIADFNDPEKKIILPAENSDITANELETAIEKHIAINELQIKAAAKAELLARLGITAEEAQLLLA